MYSRDYHEYDYSCQVCGRGYYAEVGPPGTPPCGCDEGKFLREKEEKENLRKQYEKNFYKATDYTEYEFDDDSHWDLEY